MSGGQNKVDIFEVIKARTSIRSYNEQPISDPMLGDITTYCKEFQEGPFGTPVRFKLLDLGLLNHSELRGLGTYGMIRGARYYILGAVEERKSALEDLGYCLEKIVLKASSLGLGTCWLGGTFKRAAFASKMGLSKKEMLPAITPVGYPLNDFPAHHRALRKGIGSAKRKPWDSLFFSPDGKTPLSRSDAGIYADALEAVRLGPSASNRQPWRMIKDENGVYHLFLKENKIYNRLLGKYHLQFVDMGIAMSHFELVANQSGLKGRWENPLLIKQLPALKQIATWNNSNDLILDGQTGL